ncbi:Undecaprenyl-phosphate galactose phosphotransferase WbaP/exopolysaccharide biosynthesis polyprenyl glycosylphosphotransferase [Kineococcus xinjiangensis]|uniref:Undecaprenyl-phosphate galactose phosphotransferase WbaP/exopolysaccharide biosynthesis polyprenyl glycosylphosphotransferase n=1 Tax=Kineococcus xinjiangensis TaxID=512762 RepID=A0A2S6ISM2_9ACTN|nr:sugar transferase [Kineococcus xinjiangensis]PPK97254.1 Undecaprenyl-phosphate galactose phosphotransferase WbaP/exopolysaccharide biosynthesis polyprenyl glycosylphosphotransferase [Kineococcus xinjiangensis]
MSQPRTSLNGAERQSAWQRDYVQRLVAIDAAAAAFAAFAGFFARFSDVPADTGSVPGQAVVVCAVLLPVLWVFAMYVFRTYEHRFLGVGSEEFQRVLRASLAVVAFVASTSWAFKLDIARGYVVVALPLAALLTLIGRYATRKKLHESRVRGEAVQTVVAVGHRPAVVGMIRQLHRASYHGMRIVGACVPGGPGTPEEDAELTALGIPVLGAIEDVSKATKEVDADVVAVTGCPELDGPALRRLGWDLESTRADLVVAPALTEVIGPRVAIRPVCGLPLLHVERPELQGIRRLAKSTVDRLAALSALLVFSPVLLGIAALVRLDSKGPVLFRQERVGKDGKPFTMYKFRSMVVDAEKRLIDLRETDEGNGVLFKMKVDPRITRVGRVLRRYSLDELPQLLNVLNGTMSLVGPRPPLQHEVDAYGFDMRRRLLVKPGLTGLWQINGRSDLDWDESVRLDVRYVENWSFMFDFMILWKTAGAVLRGRGAY